MNEAPNEATWTTEAEGEITGNGRPQSLPIRIPGSSSSSPSSSFSSSSTQLETVGCLRATTQASLPASDSLHGDPGELPQPPLDSHSVNRSRSPSAPVQQQPPQMDSMARSLLAELPSFMDSFMRQHWQSPSIALSTRDVYASLPMALSSVAVTPVTAAVSTDGQVSTVPSSQSDHAGQPHENESFSWRSAQWQREWNAALSELGSTSDFTCQLSALKSLTRLLVSLRAWAGNIRDLDSEEVPCAFVGLQDPWAAEVWLACSAWTRLASSDEVAVETPLPAQVLESLASAQLSLLQFLCAALHSHLSGVNAALERQWLGFLLALRCPRSDVLALQLESLHLLLTRFRQHRRMSLPIADLVALFRYGLDHPEVQDPGTLVSLAAPVLALFCMPETTASPLAPEEAALLWSLLLHWTSFVARSSEARSTLCSLMEQALRVVKCPLDQIPRTLIALANDIAARGILIQIARQSPVRFWGHLSLLVEFDEAQLSERQIVVRYFAYWLLSEDGEQLRSVLRISSLEVFQGLAASCATLLNGTLVGSGYLIQGICEWLRREIHTLTLADWLRLMDLMDPFSTLLATSLPEEEQKRFLLSSQMCANLFLEFLESESLPGIEGLERPLLEWLCRISSRIDDPSLFKLIDYMATAVFADAAYTFAVVYIQSFMWALDRPHVVRYACERFSRSSSRTAETCQSAASILLDLVEPSLSRFSTLHPIIVGLCIAPVMSTVNEATMQFRWIQRMYSNMQSCSCAMDEEASCRSLDSVICILLWWHDAFRNADCHLLETIISESLEFLSQPAEYPYRCIHSVIVSCALLEMWSRIRLSEEGIWKDLFRSGRLTTGIRLMNLPFVRSLMDECSMDWSGFRESLNPSPRQLVTEGHQKNPGVQWVTCPIPVFRYGQTVTRILFSSPCPFEVYRVVMMAFADQILCRAMFSEHAGILLSLRVNLYDCILNDRAGHNIIDSSQISIRKQDLYRDLFSLLRSLIVYRMTFSKQQQDEMVLAFKMGLFKWTDLSRHVLHSLTLCAFTLVPSMTKYLADIVHRLSQIMSSPRTSIHLLEFLSMLSRRPALAANFVDADYKIVFGIAIQYIQYHQRQVRGTRRSTEPRVNSLSKSSLSQSDPNEDGPSKEWRQATFEQYVLIMAHRVIQSWMACIRPNDRNRFIPYLVRGLLHAQFGDLDTIVSLWTLDEKSDCCVDVLAGLCLEGTPLGDPAWSIPFLATDHCVSRWLMEKSLVSIFQAPNGTESIAKVVVRRCSGTIAFDMAIPEMESEMTEALWKDARVTGAHHFYMEALSSGALSMDTANSVSIHLPPRDETVDRAIAVLDHTPAIDLHKIGVLYVADVDQVNNESSILRNARGSLLYERFLDGLGSRVTLRGCRDIFTGGLDTHDDMDGREAIFWKDTLNQDDQCNLKKRHIGNDYVTIVYNDAGPIGRFETIRGQFNVVTVLVTPICPLSNTDPALQIFSIQIQHQPELSMVWSPLDRTRPSDKEKAFRTAHSVPGMNARLLAGTEEPAEFSTNISRGGEKVTGPGTKDDMWIVMGVESVAALVRQWSMHANIFAQVNRQMTPHHLPRCPGAEFVSNSGERLRQLKRLADRYRSMKAA